MTTTSGVDERPGFPSNSDSKVLENILYASPFIDRNLRRLSRVPFVFVNASDFFWLIILREINYRRRKLGSLVIPLIKGLLV